MKFPSFTLCASLISVLIGAVSSAHAASFGTGNILVTHASGTNQYVIDEYQTNGTFFQSVNVPYGTSSFTFPVTESTRDIVIDQYNRLQAYNGTFSPYLSTYDLSSDTWNHSAYSGWTTANNVSYGGIASYLNYVFVTDMITAGDGNTRGIIRFDTSNNSAQRFANTIDYSDLNLGLDGLIYGLNSSSTKTVDVFDPISMNLLRTINLGSSIDYRAIAANTNGDIFAVDWNNGKIWRLNSSGTVINSINSGTTNLTDIDLSANGNIVVGSRFGAVIVTDTSLSSASSFNVGSLNNFVSFTVPTVPFEFSPKHGMLAVLLLVGFNLLKQRLVRQTKISTSSIYPSHSLESHQD